MATTSITKLLKKKGWTGVELGKLLVAGYINDIKKAKGMTKRDLFTQAELQSMVDTLAKPEDRQALNVYDGIFLGLQNVYASSIGMKFAFNDSDKGYRIVLLEISKTEDAKRKYDNIPYIVTQEQYDRLIAKAKENNRSYIDTYAQMFFHILDCCLDATQSDNAPLSIIGAIEYTKELPLKDGYFSNTYAEKMGLGYWLLPNGQKIGDEDITELLHIINPNLKTKYTKEELDSILNGKEIAPEQFIYTKTLRDIKQPELFFYGATAIRDYLRELTGNESPQTNEQLEAALKRIIDKPFDTKIESIAAKDWVSLIAPCIGGEWKIEAPLINVSLYDTLRLYIEEAQDADGNSKAIKQIMLAFKKEMPELFKAITDYLGDAIPSIKDTKPKDYDKGLFTWGELADAGLFGYDKLIALDEETNIQLMQLFEDDENDSAEKLSIRKRIAFSRLAIIVNPMPWQVDDNGDYKDRQNPFEGFFSIDKLSYDERLKKGIRERREELKITCRVILAHNALMEIIESVYGIPELYDFMKLDEKEIEDAIENANQLIFDIYSNAYGTAEDKKWKRQIFKEVYEPIDIKELMPTGEAIEKVRREIQGLGFTAEAKRKLEYMTNYIQELAKSTI